MICEDPSSNRVILIGTSSCPSDPERLPAIPAVVRNVKRLEQIFYDEKLVGLPLDCVSTIIDPDNPSKVSEQVAKIAREAKDTLLIYYAGHGMKAPQSRGLFLAMSGTTEENCEFNALDFDKLRRAISDSPAQKKILIVDSCFSGEITEDEMGSEQALMASNIEIKGTYAIASSPPNRKSIAPPDAEFTAFSGALIEVLKYGIPDSGEILSIDDIYREVERRIILDPSLPRPQRKVQLNANGIQIIRNAQKSMSLDGIQNQFGTQNRKSEPEIYNTPNELNSGKQEENTNVTKENQDGSNRHGIEKDDKIKDVMDDKPNPIGVLDFLLIYIKRNSLVLLPGLISAISFMSIVIFGPNRYNNPIGFLINNDIYVPVILIFPPLFYALMMIGGLRAWRMNINFLGVNREHSPGKRSFQLSLIGFLLWLGTLLLAVASGR